MIFYIIFLDLKALFLSTRRENNLFLMMHKCSANVIILMMSQLNRIVWLVKIDVDRSSDFLTHVKYAHVVFSYNANFWLVYLLSDARFDWLLRNTVVQSYIEKIFISHVINKQHLTSSVTLLDDPGLTWHSWFWY